MTDYTWADLDEANKKDGHYSRYPDYIVEARELVQKAAKNHADYIDAWMEGKATSDDVANAWDVYLTAVDGYSGAYAVWMKEFEAEQHDKADLWRVGQGG